MGLSIIQIVKLQGLFKTDRDLLDDIAWQLEVTTNRKICEKLGLTNSAVCDIGCAVDEVDLLIRPCDYVGYGRGRNSYVSENGDGLAFVRS